MRLRLLLPLALALSLAPATPAMAADWPMSVEDFRFAPSALEVAVNDKVVWTFADGGHTTTANRGQAEYWDSTKPDGDFNGPGEVYEHVFTRPGRFQFVCIPHASTMKGTIVVGEDAERDTVDNFRALPSGNRVTIKFKLNEAAKVTYRLRGPSSRTYERKRLTAGRRSFTLRRLKPGRYRGTLTLVDDFDKKVTPKKSFVIR
jgi:plastocyanin